MRATQFGVGHNVLLFPVAEHGDDKDQDGHDTGPDMPSCSL
jgi:hypothetical protein